MKFQLLDRLSFQRFAGLRRSSQIPDRTTFWALLEPLKEAWASEAVFETVGRELSHHGVERVGEMRDCSPFLAIRAF